MNTVTTITPSNTTDVTTHRRACLDWLRAGLATLVVLHHVALVYGAGAPFYYTEPPFGYHGTYRALVVFILVNQAWFMGAFFFISGILVPGSVDRKGTGMFLRGRVVRLGVPLLFFTFVLNPLAGLGIYAMPTELTGITGRFTWSLYPRFVGIGPMWFALLLLVFDTLYASLHAALRSGAPAGDAPTAGAAASNGERRRKTAVWLAALLFVVGLGALSFLWRLWIPLGRDVFGFPSLAYLPQYAAFFAVGVVAGRRQWLDYPPTRMGVFGAVAAAAALIVLFPVAFSGRPFSLELSEVLENALGGPHWQSAAYALFDSTFAAGVLVAAISALERLGRRGENVASALARLGYGVYVLHVVIVVGIAVLLRDFAAPPIVKFVAVSLLSVPTSFAAAFLLRRVPGVARVM